MFLFSGKPASFIASLPLELRFFPTIGDNLRLNQADLTIFPAAHNVSFSQTDYDSQYRLPMVISLITLCTKASTILSRSQLESFARIDSALFLGMLLGKIKSTDEIDQGGI